MNNVPNQWDAIYKQGFRYKKDDEHKKPLEKLRTSPYGDAVWLKPFVYGQFTWADYIEQRNNIQTYTDRNWPESPASTASVINHTLIYEYGNIEIKPFVERLEQESAQKNKPLIWKLKVFAAAHYLNNPTEPLKEKDLHSFLMTLTKETNVSKHNLFEELRQVENNMSWLQQVAEMIPSIEHHNWCLNHYINMLDDSGIYEMHSHTSSGVLMMYHFPLANANTIVDYGIKKKDPAVITLTMLHGNIKVEAWLQNIISWLQPSDIQKNYLKDYIRQICENIIWGLERMSQEQQEQLHQYLNNNPTLLQKLQNAVETPPHISGWKKWWDWNEVLAKKGLVDFKNPTPELQAQLNLLLQHIEEQKKTNHNSVFNLGSRHENMVSVWLAKQHPILAQALWEHTLQNMTGSIIQNPDYWIQIQKQEWDWLKNISISKTIVDLNLYEQSFEKNGSCKHQLVLMTILLPKMSLADRAQIAPISAWVFGKRSVKGLSPQTFKSMWKSLDKEYDRPVPRQYKGDVYILYGLTGSDATALQGILDSLGVQDSTTYLQMTRQWMIANTPELAKETYTPDIKVDASLFSVL